MAMSAVFKRAMSVVSSGGIQAAGAAYGASVAGGVATTGAQELATAGAEAAANAHTNRMMAQIAQQAAIAAAALKLSNDLNDATIGFMKGIGSSVKSAAQ